MSDVNKMTSRATDEAAQRRTAGIARWLDLMDLCEQFLMAGLRRKVGPEGNVAAAYREWCARQMEEHDRMIEHMAREFNRRNRRHGD